ncbi:MAG: methyl-accepting chemotaxis protein [Methylococcales bacterium]|nr:PAS domain-containing protein [Methylococcaceae bacterium]
MFNKLTIKTRLLLIITFSATLAIALSGLGLVGMQKSNAGLQNVYMDRTIPLADLAEIKAKQLDIRLKIAVSLVTPNELAQNLEQIAKARSQIDKLWAAYSQSNLTTEEKALADKFVAARKIYAIEALDPVIALMKKGDTQSVQSLVVDKLRPLFVPVADNIDALVNLQKNVAQQEYEQVDANYQQTIAIEFIALAVGITLTVLFGFILIRKLMAQLGGEPKTVADIVANVAHDQLDNTINLRKGDTDSLLANIKDMQQQLLNRRTESRHLIENTTRQKMALDSISVNVMVADTNRNIIYMNPAVLKMMQLAEADIKKSLPHFNVNNLMGANIDSFHKNPSHQKGMLANLNGTHKTEITIAGRTFSLTANPITDTDGKRLGTVVEWLDRTTEMLVEQEVAKVVSAAVAGDFSQQVSEQGKIGFSLLLAQSINQLLSTNATSLADLARVLDALSTGNLTENIQKDYAGTYGQLKDSANATVANLRQLISEIKDSTDSISMAAKEIAAGNNDLSHRTEEQASSLEQTAASMQELTSTVQHNTENARHANTLAVNATEVAGKGVNVVGQVVNTMESIHDSSRKVVEIIAVIDGIAFQTNILALNAAVEAARAGEQGRGFAVVAGEVRNLAQRAAAAAGEIKALIGNSVEQIEDGTRLVSQAGKTMEEIVNSIRGVTSIMSNIASASMQQSTGIEQVNLAIGQMDDVTQQNAALVEQAAAAAESLEEQTQNLTATLGQFKVDNRDSNTKLARSSAANNLPVPTKKPKPQTLQTANNTEWEEF